MRYALACLLLAACGDTYVDGLDRPTRVEGRLVIESDYDVDLYSEVEEVDGDLVMATGPLDVVDLPKMRRVTGKVQISGNYVELSALEDVGGALIADRDNVILFEAPALAHAGEINIAASEIAWLDLSSLVAVDGDVRLGGNENLAQCYADWLRSRITAGGVIYTSDNNPACTCSGEPPVPACPIE